MKLTRRRLTVLLNALHEEGVTELTVEHPSDEIGELLRIDIEDMDAATVRFISDRSGFAQARADIDREYGPPAVHDIPDPNSYVWACVAGGLLDVGNDEEIKEFLDRFGGPNLNAGHPPVVAGFDTNLMPWRLWNVLELDGGYTPRGDWPTVNGFALATGVRDELDWDHKHDDTRPLEKAFGDQFGRLLGNRPRRTEKVGWGRFTTDSCGTSSMPTRSTVKLETKQSSTVTTSTSGPAAKTSSYSVTTGTSLNARAATRSGHITSISHAKSREKPKAVGRISETLCTC